MYQTKCFPNPLIRSNRWQFRWRLRLIPGGANTNVQLPGPSIRGAIATVQRRYPILSEEMLR
jgi:hypothetical protein